MQQTAMVPDMPENISALQLVLTGNPALYAIVWLSLVVSLTAALFATLIGVPVGVVSVGPDREQTIIRHESLIPGEKVTV